jgi:methylated-DNA-[protein]-cysteine S-methyltransferase
MLRRSFDSPFGRMILEEEDCSLTALHWHGRAVDESSPLLLEAERQLLAYFAGTQRRFDLALAPSGTPAELGVWRLMAEIPYGETRSYGDLAEALDIPARVVGTICGRNPLPILLPCHRIVGRDGALTGFSGGAGIETKRWLLQHEGALLL